jgi:hypothetical protein
VWLLSVNVSEVIMALSKDEQAQLDALTKKATEPDEDFDIEIWDETGAGAKVPYSKGRSWLNKFGIDLPTEPPETEPSEPSEPKAPKARKQPGPSTSNVTQRYFGKDTGKAS